MEIALIISLIALAVALPGCIADSLTVIEKIRGARAKRLLKNLKFRMRTTRSFFLRELSHHG
jgi:hypothetical protein